jgi:hypothetical protein
MAERLQVLSGAAALAGARAVATWILVGTGAISGPALAVVEVAWPNGRSEHLPGEAPAQMLTIEQGRGVANRPMAARTSSPRNPARSR